MVSLDIFYSVLKCTLANYYVFSKMASTYDFGTDLLGEKLQSDLHLCGKLKFTKLKKMHKLMGNFDNSFLLHFNFIHIMDLTNT